MTQNSVDITTVAGSINATDMSIIGLFLQSDLVVKTVMLLLLLASIWCWAIIFDKWKYFRRARKHTQQFENAYRTSKNLVALYNKIQHRQDSPMAAMFVTGMYQLKNGVLKGITSPNELQLNHSKEQIFYSIQRIKNTALETMQKNLFFLATVGSAAPFVGLFGTVWGIVNSFQAIAASKNTTLVVVAPGIAEALLATAIGLFAAIPAVIFYNIFSNEIRHLAARFDDYSDELSTLLMHQTSSQKEL